MQVRSYFPVSLSERHRNEKRAIAESRTSWNCSAGPFWAHCRSACSRRLTLLTSLPRISGTASPLIWTRQDMRAVRVSLLSLGEQRSSGIPLRGAGIDESSRDGHRPCHALVCSRGSRSCARVTDGDVGVVDRCGDVVARCAGPRKGCQASASPGGARNPRSESCCAARLHAHVGWAAGNLGGGQNGCAGRGISGIAAPAQ